MNIYFWQLFLPSHKYLLMNTAILEVIQNKLAFQVFLTWTNDNPHSTFLCKKPCYTLLHSSFLSRHTPGFQWTKHIRTWTDNLLTLIFSPQKPHFLAPVFIFFGFGGAFLAALCSLPYSTFIRRFLCKTNCHIFIIEHCSLFTIVQFFSFNILGKLYT